MSNFAETTRKQFVDQATKAYMRGDYEAAAWFEKQVERHTVKPEPVKAASKPERKRCAHYGSIKEFMAVARELGLDVKAKDRCRGAVGMLLGKRVETRADLTGAEWSFCTNALRMGKLVW